PGGPHIRPPDASAPAGRRSSGGRLWRLPQSGGSSPFRERGSTTELRGSVMHTEPHEVTHHKPKHLAEKFEGMIGVNMVAAIVLLAVGLIYGSLTTGSTDPEWMQ